MLFTPPYVLISQDNSSPRRARTLAEANAALAQGSATAVAGQLRPGVLAADIDPADTGADAVLGDAVAEHLIAWCHRHNLAYYLRESGRPGGRHVLALSREPGHAAAWTRLCRDLAAHSGVAVTDRSGMALRLLSSPHRLGLPAPALGGTLTPNLTHDLPSTVIPARRSRQRAKPTAPRSEPSMPGDLPARDTTRSGREFGQACAMARAHFTADRAWREQAQPGTKCQERGHQWWRRYVWLPATVTVAAEHGATTQHAWTLSQQACPAGCRTLGYDRWHEQLWKPALRDARRDRPRRTHIHPPGRPVISSASPGHDTELENLRQTLVSVAHDILKKSRIDPRRIRSAAAALYALAPALLHREGSLDIRSWAEQARLDPKTIRSTRDLLVRHKILAVSHNYQGGHQDCARYETGLVVGGVDPTSPTSCSTPIPILGHANPARLRRAHRRDRAHRQPGAGPPPTPGPAAPTQPTTSQTVKEQQHIPGSGTTPSTFLPEAPSTAATTDDGSTSPCAQNAPRVTHRTDVTEARNQRSYAFRYPTRQDSPANLPLQLRPFDKSARPARERSKRHGELNAITCCCQFTAQQYEDSVNQTPSNRTRHSSFVTNLTRSHKQSCNEGKKVPQLSKRADTPRITVPQALYMRNTLIDRLLKEHSRRRTVETFAAPNASASSTSAKSRLIALPADDLTQRTAEDLAMSDLFFIDASATTLMNSEHGIRRTAHNGMHSALPPTRMGLLTWAEPVTWIKTHKGACLAPVLMASWAHRESKAGYPLIRIIWWAAIQRSKAVSNERYLFQANACDVEPDRLDQCLRGSNFAVGAAGHATLLSWTALALDSPLATHELFTVISQPQPWRGRRQGWLYNDRPLHQIKARKLPSVRSSLLARGR